jgi:prophage regulatory protein
MNQAISNQLRIERIDAVSARTGLPKPSIYRLMQTGQFPRSVKLSSRATGWRSTDIDQWIDELQSEEVA